MSETTSIEASKSEEVASDKYMTTTATLHRNGKLMVEVYTNNDNFWHALRGHVVVVVRDKDGNAIGGTAELSCSFRGSSSGWESSSGIDTFSLQLPEDVARRAAVLDIYQKDGRSPGNRLQKFLHALEIVAGVAVAVL